jgi:23S rRNA pseudouridine1911/1915/1917 synthase
MAFVKQYKCSKYRFDGDRLDVFLTGQFKNLSRSKVQKLIKDGEISVNGNVEKSGYVLLSRDTITVNDFKKEKQNLIAEKTDVPVLYEDNDVFVVNKPYGMIVHPVEGANIMTGTLVNAVLEKIKKDQFDGLRPGIVHRIDKDTSGLLVIAKNRKAYDDMVSQFKNRTVKKYYLALVYGILKYPEGIIESPIKRAVVNRKKMCVSSENSGKNAVSVYKTLRTFNVRNGKHRCSLLEIQIKTGRTHQIRVHMSSIGHPVIGDVVYGNRKINNYFEHKFNLHRQFLHAYKVNFISPATKKEVSIEEGLPVDLENVITQIS